LKVANDSAIYLLLYVDDMLIAAKSMTKIQKLKKQLSKEFEMENLGAVKKILDKEISRDISSGCFNMHDAKKVSTPHILNYHQRYVLNQMMILSTCMEFPIQVQLVHLCMPWFVHVLIYLMR
jgi:hypothetical protein